MLPARALYSLAALLLALPPTDAAASKARGAGAASGEIEVLYLANAGFLIEVDDHKVLIDGLFGPGLPGYPTVPGEQRRALERGRPPFDRIDVVLATHHHDDHFDPSAVARFLRAAPAARFVSTPQAVERLLRVDGARALDERVHAATPTAERPERSLQNGIPVLALALHHGRSPAAAQNLGFVLDLGGASVLHVGDTEASAAEMRAAGLVEPVDLALVTSWSRASVAAATRARRVVVMHLAEPNAPAAFFGRHGGFEQQVASLRREAPDALLALDPMTRVDLEETP